MDDANANLRRSDPDPFYRTSKRAFDVCGAALVLLLAAPLLLLSAIAIKLSSAGPVLYRARRAGRDGVPFDMFKFRTMRLHADTADRKITADGDDRITRVGSILRRSKLDELPQFWNVLRGDMSIVGPRPEDADLVERHYTPAMRRSLDTRPGIACSADVLWYPDLTYHDPPPPGISIQEHYVARHLPAQAAAGVRYVETQSLRNDLLILGGTVFCVLVRSWWRPPKRPLSASAVAEP